jgi:hypothetical protein
MSTTITPLRARLFAAGSLATIMALTGAVGPAQAAAPLRYDDYLRVVLACGDPVVQCHDGALASHARYRTLVAFHLGAHDLAVAS